MSDTALRAQHPKLAAVIDQIFLALRDHDRALWDRLVTEDFAAFEVGQVMLAGEIFDKIVAAHESGTAHVWRADLQSVRVSGELATAAWINRGSVTKDGVTTPVDWLESAAFVLVDGGWRVAFLESHRATGPV